MQQANSILLAVGKQQEKLRELYLEAYRDPNLNDYGNKEVSCAIHAITSLTNVGQFEELVEAAHVVTAYMIAKDLEAMGLIKFDYKNIDIYGFPAIYR